MFRSANYYLLILFFPFFSTARAQDNWTLSTDQEGIKVYTRTMENSNIKAVRVVANLEASTTQLLAAIMDIQTCTEWVYHSKKNILIKQVSPLDLIYYSEIEVPWPAKNRDFVVHIQAEQQPQSKVVIVNSPCIPGYVPEKQNIVRISHSVGQWTITPVSKKLVQAEYILQVDPGGTIPAWLINLFATKGPLETFKKLKVHIQDDVYKKARYAQINN